MSDISAEAYASDHKLNLIKVSAKTGENIIDLFQSIAEKIYKGILDNTLNVNVPVIIQKNSGITIINDPNNKLVISSQDEPSCC